MSDDRLIDWALGEGDESERDELQRLIESDPASALEAAEYRDVFEQMRSLDCEVTGRVAASLDYAITRRDRLRRGRATKPRNLLVPLAWHGGRIAAVAAAVLAGLVLWQNQPPELVPEPSTAVEASVAAASEPDVTATRSTADEAPDSLSGGVIAHAGGERLRRQYSQLEKLAELDSFSHLVAAHNELAMLRLEFTQRYSRRARRESIARSGGSPALEDRIQSLASDIATRTEADLASGEAKVLDTALAVRALLASGSTRRIGHRDAVSAGLDFLEAHVADLHGGELASALATLTDYAVVSQGRAAALVSEHGARLARSTLELPDVPSGHGMSRGERVVGDRPDLLRFHTPLACLADAGHVFRLAPAFGVNPLHAHEARMLVAAHVEERIEVAGGERPEMFAALLYGFGDLVDREELDRRLLLWKPGLIAGDNLVALHHLSWSQFPPRAGWAEFQSQLRGLATLRTPGRVGDASALLLTLAMNFAAPGVHGVLGLTG